MSVISLSTVQADGAIKTHTLPSLKGFFQQDNAHRGFSGHLSLQIWIQQITSGVWWTRRLAAGISRNDVIRCRHEAKSQRKVSNIWRNLCYKELRLFSEQRQDLHSVSMVVLITCHLHLHPPTWRRRVPAALCKGNFDEHAGKVLEKSQFVQVQEKIIVWVQIRTSLRLEDLMVTIINIIHTGSKQLCQSPVFY